MTQGKNAQLKHKNMIGKNWVHFFSANGKKVVLKFRQIFYPAMGTSGTHLVFEECEV